MADQPSLTQSIVTGLAGRCPRCRKGALFSGFLNVRKQCPECGLDYSFADAGDGPAIFVILISGFIVVGAALIVEVIYQPPFWLHALLWGPLILDRDAAAAASDQGPADRAAISSCGSRRPA